MPSFWIEIVVGDETQKYSFDHAPITIGRDPAADLVLDHPTVSRRHLAIDHDPAAGFRARVLSTNGLSALEGQRIQESAPLYDRANLQIGRAAFRFRSLEAPARAGAALSESGANHWDALASAASESAEASRVQSIGEHNVFQQLEEAQKRGKKANGLSPTALIGIVLIAVILLYLFLYEDPSGARAERKSYLYQPRPIEVEAGCSGAADCGEVAQKRYDYARELLEEQQIKDSNLFTAYKNLIGARESLLAADLKPSALEMSDLDAELERTRAELDELFHNHKTQFFVARSLNDRRAMTRELDAIDRYFPDATSAEAEWALHYRYEMRRAAR